MMVSTMTYEDRHSPGRRGDSSCISLVQSVELLQFFVAELEHSDVVLDSLGVDRLNVAYQHCAIVLRGPTDLGDGAVAGLLRPGKEYSTAVDIMLLGDILDSIFLQNLRVRGAKPDRSASHLDVRLQQRLTVNKQSGGCPLPCSSRAASAVTRRDAAPPG